MAPPPRFSRRLPDVLEPNALAQAVARARAGSSPLLDLTVSNPTAVGFSYPRTLSDSLADPAGLQYDPSARGLMHAREAIARDYGRRGIAADPERILLTASTSEAYSFLFKLLCDPGDEVLVPAPSYPLFEHLTVMDVVKARPYRLDYHGVWSIDLESFHGSFGGRTKAALVVSPNNPTGSLLRGSQWPEVREACERRAVTIVCDEVFGDYLIDPAEDGLRSVMMAGPAGNGPLTFVLSGLSKLVGLPQHKLAWMILDGAPALVEEARRRLELISDTYLSVATAVQRAAPRLLQDGAQVRDAIAARVRDNWRALRAEAARWPACDVLRVEGGWSAVLRVPSVRSEEALVLELVEQDGVLVHPGFFFDFDREAFLVISLLPEPATFAEGMARVFRRAG